MKTELEWISVGERLPSAPITVLVILRDGPLINWKPAFYDGYRWKVLNTLFGNWTVTDWAEVKLP